MKYLLVVSGGLGFRGGNPSLDPFAYIYIYIYMHMVCLYTGTHVRLDKPPTLHIRGIDIQPFHLWLYPLFNIPSSSIYSISSYCNALRNNMMWWKTARKEIIQIYSYSQISLFITGLSYVVFKGFYFVLFSFFFFLFSFIFLNLMVLK